MKSAHLWFLIGVIAIEVGCKKEETSQPTPCPSVETLVCVATQPDTLWLGTSDTTSRVTVIVTDECRQPRAGAVVSFAVSDPASGDLTFVDPAHGDITDNHGELALIYHAAQEGHNQIIALVNDVTEQTTLVTRDPQLVRLLVIALDYLPPILDFTTISGDTGSVLTTATVNDTAGFGVPGLTLHFGAQRGAITPQAVTDLNGRCEVTWLLDRTESFPAPGLHEVSVEATAEFNSFSGAALLLVRR